MRFRFVYIFVLFLFSREVNAQELNASFQTGYGFYNMSSLAEFTRSTYNQLPFQAKIISNYPAYHYYIPMLKISGDYFEFGLNYLFQTTGSRISSRDYSGEYRLDTRINSNSPGIMLGSLIEDNDFFKMGMFVQSGFNFSVFKISELLQVDTMENTDELKLKSTSFYVEPGFRLLFPYNRVCFEFNIGYYKEFKRNDFTLKNDVEVGIPVKKDFFEPDIWDGLRIGIGMSYTLFKKTEK
jgi:hypothetical protein